MAQSCKALALGRAQPDPATDQLWLPLDLLESRSASAAFEGQLKWFGRRQPLDQLPQRTLGDEVGLEVADWLAQAGSAFVWKAGSCS